jgi:Na+/H+ antiporter NhaC
MHRVFFACGCTPWSRPLSHHILMRTFIRYTLAVLLLLSVVLVVAWFYRPREHFILVASVCYGYLIGWLSAWFVQVFYARRQRRQRTDVA